ncbi:MAG: S-ribosylhomocysteine lyase [Spirochaetaceae bacterium]|nr:S-ribosylhomocysteine lyase [Spirochaetaceae bacterium]
MEKAKYNVESFNLDHTKVTAPYVRLASKKIGPKTDIVSKFDIRITQPNKEFMPIAGIHTIEHLVAEYIRDELSDIIDFSPMGCRTGFYLTLFGEYTEEYIAEKLLIVMKKVATWPKEKAIPGLSPVECGNYKEHDLEAAQFWANNWIKGITEKGVQCIK